MGCRGKERVKGVGTYPLPTNLKIGRGGKVPGLVLDILVKGTPKKNFGGTENFVNLEFFFLGGLI